jgi:hypothetical protein
MARGNSGRIVLEVDPILKAEVYSALARDGLTLRAWFIREAQRYLSDRYQPALFAAERPSREYGASARRDDER